jgi:hypothetical protein
MDGAPVCLCFGSAIARSMLLPRFLFMMSKFAVRLPSSSLLSEVSIPRIESILISAKRFLARLSIPRRAEFMVLSEDMEAFAPKKMSKPLMPSLLGEKSPITPPDMLESCALCPAESSSLSASIFSVYSFCLAVLCSAVSVVSFLRSLICLRSSAISFFAALFVEMKFDEIMLLIVDILIFLSINLIAIEILILNIGRFVQNFSLF